MRGFVDLIKPSGISSGNMVARVRGVLSRAVGARQKVGHLGTLDPLATGVLPIAVGTATRLFDSMLEKKKRYIATFRFGMTTDTLDSDGAVTEVDDLSGLSDRLDRQIDVAASSLAGEMWQLPPQYSAKSVGGKRAYDIARAGGVAELKPKKITIYDIKRVDEGTWRSYADELLGARELGEAEYAFDITCSSGTYIRAIARDLAEKLGTVGYMSSLVRVQSGCFTLDDAVSFERFESDPLRYMLPIEVYTDSLPRFELPADRAAAALSGIRIDCDMPQNERLAVYFDGEVVALGECREGKLVLTARL